MTIKDLLVIVLPIMLLLSLPSASSALCSTAILIGKAHLKLDPLTTKYNPIQLFDSLNKPLEDAREHRVKRIEFLEKYSGNCAALIVVINNHAISTAMTARYERIGIRTKDSFVFIVGPTFKTGFFDFKNLQNNFRSVSLIIEGDSLETEIENPITTNPVAENRVQLSGRSIKVAAIPLPPLVTFDKTGRQRPPTGCFVDTFETAAKTFNFTLKLDYGMFRRGGQGRPMPNGTWSGVLGGLMREEVDVTFMGHQVARYRHVEYTTLLLSDASSFLIKRPNVKVRWTALIDPLMPPVWLFSVISIFLVTACIYATLRLTKPAEKRGKILHLSIMDPLSVVLEQGATMPYGTRLLMYCWVLTVLILETGYKDKLMMFLTFPELEEIPLELKDFNLPQFKDYQLLQDGWLISFRLNNSNDPDVIKMKDRFEFKANSAECTVAATLNEKTACIGYDQFMAVSIAYNLTVNLHFFAPVQSPQGAVISGIPVSIGLHKDSSMTPDWNKITGMYRDSGLYERFKLDALARLKLEGLKGTHEGPAYEELREMMLSEGMVVKPLKISNFATIFIVLMLGLCVSSWVFLKELGFRGLVKIMGDCRNPLKISGPDELHFSSSTTAITSAATKPRAVLPLKDTE